MSIYDAELYPKEQSPVILQFIDKSTVKIFTVGMFVLLCVLIFASITSNSQDTANEHELAIIASCVELGGTWGRSESTYSVSNECKPS